jgi:hypothetical protein
VDSSICGRTAKVGSPCTALPSTEVEIARAGINGVAMVDNPCTVLPSTEVEIALALGNPATVGGVEARSAVVGRATGTGPVKGAVPARWEAAGPSVE